MSELVEVWVDFNDVSDESTTETLCEYVEGVVREGDPVLAYDGDGNSADARVQSISGALVTLRLDMSTFSSSRRVMHALV
ncbi:hypothetical protein [Kineococcus sp. SYSU DK002]|uniref:hypothetical protein n=1 Tax=Kineococcus sp. SYSU DK002 TaxID=3383123 RepID=UPI003D7DC54B